MHRRAFHWTSIFMIGVLTAVDFAHVVTFPTTAINSDSRLSGFLNDLTRAEDNPGSNKTFGQWVMAYHPLKNLNQQSHINNFLTSASSTPQYAFDLKAAAAFHDLLLSSLYAYLCLLKQLKNSITNQNKEEIRRSVGPFSTAVRILYLISHCNAMKAYFTYVRNPMLTKPSYQDSGYHKNLVNTAIMAVYTKLKLNEVENMVDSEDGVEDPNSQENLMEDFKENGAGLSYRRSLMSFVDHFAGLRLLERRSLNLPPLEQIKLCLVAVKHPTLRYLSWNEMEVVIRKMCQDFQLTSSNPVKLEGQEVISKIKELLDGINESDLISDKAIISFKSLLANYDVKGSNELNPLFPACIHCELLLVAILSQLHAALGNSDLHTLFQARPFSPPSSLTP